MNEAESAYMVPLQVASRPATSTLSVPKRAGHPQPSHLQEEIASNLPAKLLISLWTKKTDEYRIPDGIVLMIFLGN